jgi:diketogulonate reductase-like aldo/keto reductase
MNPPNNMQEKALGRTDVSISEVGLGTWGLHAGPEVLLAGLDAGASFIDTAESYATEAVVAEAITGRRDRVFVATKISPHNFRRAAVFEAADASLRRLRTDRIDLYQLHHPSNSIPIEETLAAMEELVDAGKVRFIGVSNFSVAQMEAALRALRRHPLVSNQVRYNLADRTIADELLPWCQAHGITVIAYSPLAREFQRILDCDPNGTLAELSRETGHTPAQIALNWCLGQEGVVVIPKSNTIVRTVENCGASGWRLSAAQRQRLDHSIVSRRRGTLDRLIRRYTPSGLAPILKTAVRVLPRSIRRRVT